MSQTIIFCISLFVMTFGFFVSSGAQSCGPSAEITDVFYQGKLPFLQGFADQVDVHYRFAGSNICVRPAEAQIVLRVIREQGRFDEETETVLGPLVVVNTPLKARIKVLRELGDGEVETYDAKLTVTKLLPTEPRIQTKSDDTGVDLSAQPYQTLPCSPKLDITQINNTQSVSKDKHSVVITWKVIPGLDPCVAAGPGGTINTAVVHQDGSRCSDARQGYFQTTTATIEIPCKSRTSPVIRTEAEVSLTLTNKLQPYSAPPKHGNF